MNKLVYLRGLALLMLVGALSSQAQSDADAEDIAVLARPGRDSIVLRWAPRDVRTWIAGRQKGYRIERFVMARDGQLLPTPEKRVLHPAVFPWEEHKWEPIVRSTSYGAIAAQAMFGDRFELDVQQSDVFSIVNKVRENEQRHSFTLFCADMSPAVARAAGLWFTDRNVRSNERYLYRVVVNGSAQRGSLFTFCDAGYDLLPPSLTVRLDGIIASLKWDRAVTGIYSAYLVERSTNGRDFTTISELPQVTASASSFEDTRYVYAVDSLPRLYQRYYYRVRGISPFGELGPPSNVVDGVAVRNVSQTPQILAVENIDNTSIRITWDFPETDNPLLVGFEVERATSPDSRYFQVSPPLPADTRIFEDRQPQTVNYYRVVARGLNGTLHISHAHYVHLVDSVPPAMPTGLHARIDENGYVTLTWDENPESDLYGYRVFRSYYASEEPFQLTTAPIRSASIKDTVNVATLNEFVYYSVMAVDRNQNHSALTAPLQVALPDRTAPQPPALLPLTIEGDSILLRWKPSPSQDVQQYKIYLKRSADSLWQQVALIDANLNEVHSYTHTGLRGQANFTLTAVDKAGLESIPAPPLNAFVRERAGSSISWKRQTVDRNSGSITLVWDYHGREVKGYRIYRAIDDGALVLHRQVPGDSSMFNEIVGPGKTYTYRIVAVLLNGALSPMSKPVTLTY